MQTSVSDIPVTSRFFVLMKGLGGLYEVLQLMSNHGAIEQPIPRPMPKQYGTVKFPQFEEQPELVIAVAFVAVVMLVNPTTSNESIKRWNRTRERMLLGMFLDEH